MTEGRASAKPPRRAPAGCFQGIVGKSLLIDMSKGEGKVKRVRFRDSQWSN